MKPRHFALLAKYFYNNGTLNLIEFIVKALLDRLWLLRVPYTLHPRSSKSRLKIRNQSSDLAVFVQVFLNEEYGYELRDKKVPYIIDCGANVGFSAAYLLSKYPESRLLAIEPDPDNFACLVENTRSFGGRCNYFEGGVWSHNTNLEIDSDTTGSGREWSRRLRERSTENSASIATITIPQAMNMLGAESIAILKVDIEGAEAVVFDRSIPENDLSFLKNTNCIMIEIHDNTDFGDAARKVKEAVQHLGFIEDLRGELTILTRQSISQRVALDPNNLTN
jgi:FkbM family methyltransferase